MPFKTVEHQGVPVKWVRFRTMIGICHRFVCESAGAKTAMLIEHGTAPETRREKRASALLGLVQQVKGDLSVQNIPGVSFRAKGVTGVVSFRSSDGRLHSTEEEATEHQAKVDRKGAIQSFIDNYWGLEIDRHEACAFLESHRKELLEVLK